MKKLTYLLMLSVFMVVFTSCEEDDDVSLNYVDFQGVSPSVIIDIDGSTTQDVVVYTSTTSGSDRTFNISVDEASTAAAGSYTVPSSVTVPAGSNEGILTIALADVDLGIGVNELILNIEKSDEYFSGDSLSLTYIQACIEVVATININFDAYSEESAWSIEDSLGGTVASSGEYAAGLVSVTETVTLCSGRDYTFTFTDSYGDGMAGSYELVIDGEAKVSGPGAGFATTESNDFDTN